MTADVIVIGAGVIGAATAFHLARLGAGKMTVLERDTAGAGMSGRSSALIRMHYTLGPEVELAVRSDAMFDSWPDLAGKPACVRRTGFAQIVAAGEEARLRANVAMQRSLGAHAEVVDAAALAGLAPGLRTDDISCAAWEEHGGYSDGVVVAGDLLAAARDLGAGYRPHTAVRSLLRKADAVTGVETYGGPLTAGVVVLAAGVWAPALARTTGLTLPIETEFHRVAVLAHSPGLGAPVACIDSTTQTYFRPEGGGSMTLIGSFDGERGVAPDDVPLTAGADELAPLAGAASWRVPALADAGIARGTPGVYDMTPDARPLLGEMPGVTWTYSLDGALRTAPFLTDLRACASRLARYPVELSEWGGFLFVRLGPAQAGAGLRPGAGDANPADSQPHAGEVRSARPPAVGLPPGQSSLTDWLGEIPRRLTSYPLAQLRTGSRLVYQVAANWKVILENYNECYHCGPVHPELCDLVPVFRRGGGDLDWDGGIPHREGTWTFTRSGLSDRAPFPGLSEQERRTHKGELILPNLMMSLSADHVAAFTIWPVSAQHTTVVCDFLFHPGEMARPGFYPSDAVEFWDLVNRQDWSVCEQVQDGMRSRVFTAGYLAPMEEPSADVGRYVAGRLGSGEPRDDLCLFASILPIPPWRRSLRT